MKNDTTDDTSNNAATASAAIDDAHAPFPAARFIKEIGRGKKGARSLTREDARRLYAAMLDGRVSDLELGGIMLAMRIKGESVEEIAGFLAAAHASFDKLPTPDGSYAPVVIPTEDLAPKMARLLAMRRILGVRNSTHTLVKIMQPFAGPALRLVAYTHPEYQQLLTAYFGAAAPAEGGDVLLMRGTEGETVANAKRAQQIEWFHAHRQTRPMEKQEPVDDLPPLPAGSGGRSTAAWIRQALVGEQPVPAPIAEQVRHCLRISKNIHAQRAAL